MIGAFDPLKPEIPVGDWVDSFQEWFIDAFQPAIDAVEDGLEAVYDLLYDALSAPPFLVMVALFALLGWMVRSWRFAIFAAVAFYLVEALGQWDNTMKTLSLVILAAVIAVILAIPLGILAAKSRPVSSVMRPLLDFMQTMPAFLYLLPVLLAFGIGPVAGMVATIIFAMPPGVRLTELAIRQVDAEVVEAGQAYGAPPMRILRQIQLPLALPTIMAGINQVIMLALSMVVLASMVGAPGLGTEVLRSVSNINIAIGVQPGLCVVILAIYLDRVVAALADRAPVVRASRVRQ